MHAAAAELEDDPVDLAPTTQRWQSLTEHVSPAPVHRKNQPRLVHVDQELPIPYLRHATMPAKLLINEMSKL